MAKLIVAIILIGGLLPTTLDSKKIDETIHNRSKRQVNPLIPNSIGHYPGSSQAPIDKCPRSEVLFSDGNCYQLLTQGPCALNEYLVLNPSDNSPYCVERLCFPDRIFVFSDQLCHDPRTTTVCPPGRELYETMYGTPICQCPDGTYEGDDDLDDDVCEPLLGQTPSCPAGQIFWFKDFSLPPECVPDPCGGDNLNRGPNDQPFVPFSDGRCFQIGTMPNVCPAQTWYSIALERLQGVCSSLEDAGYQVFDSETLKRLVEIYGPPIARDSTAPIPTPIVNTPGVSQTVTPTGELVVGRNPSSFSSNSINGGLGVETPAGNSGIPTGVNIDSGRRPGTVRPTSGGQALFTPGLSIQQQGIHSQNFDLGGQGATFQQSGQGIALDSGIPGRPSHSFGSESQSTLGAGIGGNVPYIQANNRPNIENHGTITHGISKRPGSQSGIGGQSFISQGLHSQQFVPGSNTAFRRPGDVGIHRGDSTAFNFQGSSFRPGFSQRPATPFMAMDPHHKSSPSFNINNGQLSAVTVNDQSLEIFGMHDDDIIDFRMGNLDIPHAVGDVRDLDIQEAHLLANLDVPPHSSQQEIGGLAKDVSLLQAPQGHRLHGFFNSVRELIHHGPHNRSRRSPQPHAAPGNVFETRLVGCRAGAARDINSKCRDTVLPARTPAGRPSRAAPPVPPRRGCPNGQAFNIQRMCVGTGNAVNSINAFNLG